jgi:polysaccharide export outer membrane protein
MSKPVLLPTILLTVIILFVCLAHPLVTLADQIEDILVIDQQNKPVDDGTSGKGNGQTSSVWKRLLGSVGLGDEKPATTTEQESTATTSAPSPSANQEPVATPEKPASEKPAEEKIDPDHQKTEQDSVAVLKTGAEKTVAEKSDLNSATPTNTPVAAQKTTDAPSSSKWNSFLGAVGLHDDRHSIPPKEVKNSALYLGQDYIIGPGDLLSISVWRDDSLSRSVVVLPDGKIQFPLIGEVVAGGKSVTQLKQEFVEKLSSYVIDADISVEVKQSNSLFIYIIGRVNGPGRQMLVADTTVLQGLAMAGGLNPFAEKDDIKIFRQEKDRTLVYSFRYSQVVTGNYLDDNLLLKRGDVIVVP